MTYTVFIDDNFHYMDEDHRIKVGRFKTAEKAIAKCRRIVEESVRHLAEGEQTAAELSAQYALFGDDPFIVPEAGAEPVKFSARDYAGEYCRKLKPT